MKKTIYVKRQTFKDGFSKIKQLDTVLAVVDGEERYFPNSVKWFDFLEKHNSTVEFWEDRKEVDK